MIAKELIELNNEKQKLLTAENEAYYGDILVYIRLQTGLSEQQTEELVMELLDHLLDAQEAGKTAEAVFGNDPKSYCNEMIAQLPKEKGKKKLSLASYLIVQLIGFMLLGSGIVQFIAGFFTDTSVTVHLGSSVLVWIIDIVLVFAAVSMILFILKKSLFKKTSKIKDGISFAVTAIPVFLGFIFLPKWLPTFGPTFDVPGTIVLVMGLFVLLAAFVVNKRYRII